MTVMYYYTVVILLFLKRTGGRPPGGSRPRRMNKSQALHRIPGTRVLVDYFYRPTNKDIILLTIMIMYEINNNDILKKQ